MVKSLSITLMVLVVISGRAQNRISYPKDTLLSKPELNFEVLWHTFEDNYAFFKLRNIDWHKTYQVYRPQITASVSDDSLYSIFSRMLSPFQDNHINVIVPGIKQFKSVKPSQFVQEFPTDSSRNQFREMVDLTLGQKGFEPMQHAGPENNGSPLFTYTTFNRVGYIRFNRCFVDGDAESIPDAKAAGKIFDSMLAKFKKVNRLIVDVRDNIGGNDEFASALAGRFTNQKIVGMYKQTRNRGAGYEEFGKLDTWYIIPEGEKRFTKPVVLLTNDKTVSAGDVFAMIMSELPNVKIIGSNTRGIYSDMYGFTLPNGWLISLSNQRYYNNKMVCYEGKGTPVSTLILNTRRDLQQMNDPVLEEGIRQSAQRP